MAQDHRSSDGHRLVGLGDRRSLGYCCPAGTLVRRLGLETIESERGFNFVLPHPALSPDRGRDEIEDPSPSGGRGPRFELKGKSPRRGLSRSGWGFILADERRLNSEEALLDGGISAELVGSSRELHLALVHHVEAMREGESDLERLLDEQDGRAALVDGGQDFREALDEQGGEPYRRLVHP